MDLLKLASQHLGEKLKLDLDGDGVPDNLSGAFSNLMSKTGVAGIDLAGIVEKMQTSGGSLQEIVSSWLGDGENMPISKEQITDIFPGEKISEFANKLGVSYDDAATALSEVLPKIIDTASGAGNLLDSLMDEVSDKTGGFLNSLKNLFK